MPTSIDAFARIAADHGGIDPTDIESIQKWYLETLPTLSPEQLESALEKLLDREGADNEIVSALGPSYPRDATLPKLDEAQHVPLPLLAAGVMTLLKRLLRIKPSEN
jgi:hypothetical protein